MKLLETVDKAILDMKNQKYGFALFALMEIRAKLTPEFEIGENVGIKDEYEEFGDSHKIDDCLFSLRDNHFYFNSPDWEFILPADEIEKVEVKK